MAIRPVKGELLFRSMNLRMLLRTRRSLDLVFNLPSIGVLRVVLSYISTTPVAHHI